MSALRYTLAVLLSCCSTRRMIAITKSLLMSAGLTVCMHSLGISNERWQQVLSVSIPFETTATLPASRCQTCVEVYTLHSLEQEFTSLKPLDCTNRNSRASLFLQIESDTCFVFLHNWLVTKKKLAQQQTFKRLCCGPGEAELNFHLVFQSAPDNMTLIFLWTSLLGPD